jgi:dolichyl-phosphate beta-glucosyltransferase
MTELAGGPVCLIIPCYNEAQRLDVKAFQQFLFAAPHVTLIFVDDGSRDRTADVLAKTCAGFENTTQLLQLPQNRGKAEAVRAGMLLALEQLRPAVIGFWDADLATPLDTLPRFLKVLAERSEIEMVFGARVQLLGRNVRRTAVRHYLGRIFATAVSWALDLAIYDTQCGAKLFRVSTETRSLFEDPFLSKWVFDVEILARYRLLYARKGKSLEQAIYEYPLESWADIAGSKVGLADFFAAFKDVVRIRNRYL